MTLTTLQPYIDTSIASKTASSVLTRVFTEIKGLSNASEYSETWIENSLNILRFSKDIEEGFAHGRATMLAIFKDRWDDLPLSFRKQHGYEFINFAKIWTGGKAKSTIEAYILAAKLWILDEFGTGKVVEIKERSPEGKPLRNKKGAEITKLIEFCPYSVPISKLELLNPRARNNDMTDKLWEMLVDDFYTCDDIRQEHNKDKQDGNGPQYVLKYDLSGPFLVAYQNGSPGAQIAEFNWGEYETDPLVKESIDTILKVLGVSMEEDKIYKMVRDTFK